ncbi:hypothetical protein EU508_17300 [Pseudoalteromonas fuliginea]|uniref:STAS/SEC14 domain-containing protein n=1 Tax=Pseudoalteromonas fuliginea TaxID=1872678 RepID=A0AB73BD27_9GAMM|nr:hypothetical protein [Pseudoalteromonas fuliginea]KAA1157481.1 hypothetical protein EU508_17300 [Pseudoalteromonas fuliginea]
MTTIKYDSSLWPLAVTVAKGECTLAMHLDSLISWDRWFDRAEAFIVVRVYTDEASLQHPKGAGPATQEWLKNGAAEKMQQLVQAMLIVVPDKQYQKLQNMSVQKAFGIPGAVFKSLDDAKTWLQASAKEIAIPENIELQDVATLVHSHCGNTN